MEVARLMKIWLSAFRQPILPLSLGASTAATEDAFVLLRIHVDRCISWRIQWQEKSPTRHRSHPIRGKHAIALVSRRIIGRGHGLTKTDLETAIVFWEW